MSKLQHCGFISLLYSIGDKPLNLWSKYISPDGKVRRVADEILNGDKVIEITGPHEVPICTNISCPAEFMEVLNIKLPVLVIIIKNLQLKLKLEFQILDKKRYRRKITFITHENSPTINVTTAQLPLKLEEDWNNLEINFQSLCQDIFGTDYEVLQRIIIYPNCCLRRIYLQDRHYKHDETPVELCQAFFDMYLLKWGIHLVDRSSQTEESYTGTLQPSDLECYPGPLQENDPGYKSDGNKAALPIIPKASYAFHNVTKRMGNKFVSFTHVTDKDKIDVKLNSKSVNELDTKGKAKKSENNLKSNKQEAIDDKIKTTQSPSVYLNDLNTSSPKTPLNFPHLEKSKYLQTFRNPFLNKLSEEGKIFSKWPYKLEEIKDKMKSVPTINEVITNNVKSTSNDLNKKVKDNFQTSPTKQSILKAGIPDSQDYNMRNIKNIINEVQSVREHLVNKNFDFDSQDDVPNLNDNTVPYFVELEAKPLEKKSKSKLLTSDAIVSEFLKSRFTTNKMMYERLKEKGLTMTEVELSIYNSKNRRNCYGQGKLIESCRGSATKGTGLRTVKSAKVDGSSKDEKLKNNNEDATKQKKQLDVILFPFQGSNPYTSSTQILSIPEGIDTKVQINFRKMSKNVRSASVNYLWKEGSFAKISEKCNSIQLFHRSNSQNGNKQLII